jgi:hypothetical protein
MPTKKRPFISTPEYKALVKKQDARKFKFFVKYVKYLVTAYPSLRMRVWMPPAKNGESPTYGRLYVGYGGGYLTFRPPGELDPTQNGGTQYTFIPTTHLYPAQQKAWNALNKEYKAELKSSIETWYEVETGELDALAKKMGYEV